MLQSVPHHARSTNDAIMERTSIFLALCGVEWPGRRERSFDASVQQATPSLATLNQWAFHTVCVLLGTSVHQWVGRYRPPTIVKATLGLYGWVLWAPQRCGGILFSNMSDGLVGAAPGYMDAEPQQLGVQQSSFQASSNPLPLLSASAVLGTYCPFSPSAPFGFIQLKVRYQISSWSKLFCIFIMESFDNGNFCLPREQF